MQHAATARTMFREEIRGAIIDPIINLERERESERERERERGGGIEKKHRSRENHRRVPKTRKWRCAHLYRLLAVRDGEVASCSAKAAF